MAKRENKPEPVGETLRRQRVEVLDKSLREMADLLEVTSAHLSDLEKGRRTPSEELLQRISKRYQVREGVLRAGWLKLDEIVKRVGTQDAESAEKVPALLSAAEHLSSSQWDTLIEHAERMARSSEGRTS